MRKMQKAELCNKFKLFTNMLIRIMRSRKANYYGNYFKIEIED